MRTLQDVELQGKRVLMRVDFNIPMDESGQIIDDTKMAAPIPTIQYILEEGASLILMSHLGRPKADNKEKFSLKPVGEHLATLLNKPVQMASDCKGAQVKAAAQNLQAGEILLLENVRFCAEEEQNDLDFARELASLGDIYVNDAFGSAHRAHASTAGVAQFLPAYAGFLMEKEIKMLQAVLESPQRPRLAILGGAKVADKLALISNLTEKLDVILIGGGMANTFIKAQGHNTGNSKVEDGLLEEARNLLAKAASKNVSILLPIDVVLGAEVAASAAASLVKVNEVPDNMMILDIGPETVKMFTDEILKAGTIIWNGPLGVYEYEQFANGTREVAKAVAKSEAVSVIGGGDSAAAVQNMGLEKNITHISTGGGATLEFLEGLPLPGVVACG